MKFSILSVVCLVTLSFTSCNPQELKSTKLLDQFSGKSILYLDVKHRQEIVLELKKHVQTNYVLLSIKSKLGIVPDSSKLFNDAVALETTIANVDPQDDVAQSKANLEFFDRVQRLIASFKDTHFSGRTVMPRSSIANGLQLDRVGRDVIVTATRPKILTFDQTISNDPDSIAKIKPGVKVLSVDGQDIEESVKELRPFISASTEEWNDSMAVYYLAIRSFHLPNKSFADWEFQEASGEKFKVRLPYFYKSASGSSPRDEEEIYFSSIGIKPLTDLQLEYSTEKNTWSKTEAPGLSGYIPNSAPNGMIGITEWNGVNSESGKANSPTFRTGYLLKAGKSYGVLQVFEFVSDEVTKSATGSKAEKSIKFADAAESFIKELKASQTPLILDLRKNGGGNPMNAISLLSAIAKTGEVYPSTTRALRVTSLIRQMAYQGDNGNLPNLNNYIYDQQFPVKIV